MRNLSEIAKRDRQLDGATRRADRYKEKLVAIQAAAKGDRQK